MESRVQRGEQWPKESPNTEWKGEIRVDFWILGRCQKKPAVRRFYSPSPRRSQTPGGSGPVGGAGAPGAAAAAADASWFKHTSPHTHQHTHVCTGNLLNPQIPVNICCVSTNSEPRRKLWNLTGQRKQAVSQSRDPWGNRPDWLLAAEGGRFLFKNTKTQFQPRRRSPSRINRF